MAVAFGVLGFAPQAFWSMTPKELEAALRGRFGAAFHDETPSRADVAALMRRFPDSLPPRAERGLA